MRISLTVSLCVALGFINSVNMSFPELTEDFEGSGYDLNTAGSGDWSDQGEINNVKDQPDSNDVRIFASKAGGGTKDTLHYPVSGSEFVVANSKSFLENKEIFAGIVAGAVIGATVGVAVAAILIYKSQMDDYHSPNSKVIV
ncbi:hypothetical protein PAMA_006827 [Pampus argenteus]